MYTHGFPIKSIMQEFLISSLTCLMFFPRIELVLAALDLVKVMNGQWTKK